MWVGACLVLEHKHNGEEQEGVGVLVDLVLCYTVEGYIESRDLKQEALSLLKSINKPIHFSKYQLSRKDEGFDSGYVQQQMLKQLPEDVKRAYRGANIYFSQDLSQTILVYRLINMVSHQYLIVSVKNNCAICTDTSS